MAIRILLGKPAIIFDKPKRTVVISDLHLGFESELWSSGVRVPNSSWRIVEEITQLIHDVKAERLLIVGDVKHHIIGASWQEYKTLPRMFKHLRQHVEDILIIPGNHDGGLQDLIGDLATILPTRGYYVEEEKTGFFHGHVWPGEQLLNARTIIAGHMHPVVYLREDNNVVRQRVWLLLKTSRSKLRKRARGLVTLIIMPSFNGMLTGKDVTVVTQNSGRSPLLRSGIFNLDEAEVITIDGVNLGKLAILKQEV